MILENQWVRATRITYAPGETAPVHDHPRGSAIIYVYLTDAGPMRFRHFRGDSSAYVTVRPPVKAGSVRLAPGGPETHAVDYLGDVPSEYLTLELRASARVADKRLPPVQLDISRPAAEVQFENAEVRVVRVSCVAGALCPESGHPKDPAVVVVLAGPRKGEVKWSPEKMEGPMQQIRFEIKATPAR